MCQISGLLAASLSSPEYSCLKKIATCSGDPRDVDLPICEMLTHLRLIEKDPKSSFPSITDLGRSVLTDKAMSELP